MARCGLLCEIHGHTLTCEGVAAALRCKCCLRIKPVWLAHGGYHYCSFSCAEAWGEELRTLGVALLAAARLKRADELRPTSQAMFLAAAKIGRCTACTGLTLEEDLVTGRCPACRPGTAELVIARCRAARAHLDQAAAAIAGGRR